MQRNELVIRASAVGLDPTTIPNDSKLEQKILYLEKRTITISGTAPTTTLTASGVFGNTETMTVGTTVYTFKTALTGVIASAVLTSNGTIPNDGDRIDIGITRYVFKTTLDTGGTLYTVTSGTNQHVEVLINGSAANALINLKKAINATGVFGTDYTSTVAVVANPVGQATTITATQLTVTRFFAGTDNYLGSAVTTTVIPQATTLSWSSPIMTGGVNPVANEILIGAAATNTLDNIKDAINGTTVSGGRDVTYSSNTVRHPDVTAGAKTATTLVIATTDTNANGSIATTETIANSAFTGATMSAGTLGSVAANQTATFGIAGLSGDRNTTI
jgi:hypothetical protein